MAEFFTTDHFKLLHKWKGQKRDDSNPEQNQAYTELKKAYELTEAWAKLVQERLFPDGWVEIRKRPTSMANNFIPYNWAKIYPTGDSPEELAYTVGIDSDRHFVVKIDTVQIPDGSPLRKKFEAIRGPYGNSSPIMALLDADQGLELSMPGLVDWCATAIGKFAKTYDDMVQELGLVKGVHPPEPPVPLSPILTVHKPINRIYYGPPGTGKTFELQRLLLRDYTTPVSETSVDVWRSDRISKEFAELTWWEAIAAAIYDLGGKAKVGDLELHPFIRAKLALKNRNSNITQSIWGTLQHHTIEESTTVKVKIRHAPAVFDKAKDSVWILAGDWQVECGEVIELVEEIKKGPAQSGASIRRYEFVTFHQSYGYEEFIEGLRPVLDQEANQPPRYTIAPGVFRRLCEQARKNPHHRYAMVIDEVNRGNISKIFGELISLIETDKREGCENQLTVRLPFSSQEFSVPANVDILGSMNTADRSLALLDTALRRRFEFMAVLPDPELLKDVVVTKDGIDIRLKSLLEIVNKRIEALFDRDHTIGHAYFLGLGNIPAEQRFKALKDVFEKRILPLLEEYFFDDGQKIRLVLGDNQKSKPDWCFMAEPNADKEWASLFGRAEELALGGPLGRYARNPKALDCPQAYVGIYEPVAP